jgi:hypothetical protein
MRTILILAMAATVVALAVRLVAVRRMIES